MKHNIFESGSRIALIGVALVVRCGAVYAALAGAYVSITYLVPSFGAVPVFGLKCGKVCFTELFRP